MGLRRGKKDEPGEESSPRFSVHRRHVHGHAQKAYPAEKKEENVEQDLHENKEENEQNSKHGRHTRHGKRGDGSTSRGILTLKGNPFSRRRDKRQNLSAEHSGEDSSHSAAEQILRSNEPETKPTNSDKSASGEAREAEKDPSDPSHSPLPPVQPTNEGGVCKLSDSILFGTTFENRLGSFRREQSDNSEDNETSPPEATLGYHRSFGDSLAASKVFGSRSDVERPIPCRPRGFPQRRGA
uniref:Uncharacterized protein n=1 Tax=Neospora caninum (strain Liverpool) TaxID=572307 RepID=A0A0F7ULJ1_NEOCL|nr:TPA: hypothetical protein BN1204_066470 [Neospora caninum Liverpool]